MKETESQTKLSLKLQAYQYLKTRILNCEYRPNEFLNEQKLCAEMGNISRTPMRDALGRLEQEGLITLKEGAGITATKADIAENPKNLDIVELEASQLPVRLADVDMAVINGNYAIDAGLKVSDAVAIEAADGEAASAYVNVLAVEEGRENDPAIQALAAAMTSSSVASLRPRRIFPIMVSLNSTTSWNTMA